MQDVSIANLRSELERAYGARVQPQDSSPDDLHGFAFRIDGIPATFSVVTREEEEEINRYDIHVEGTPPAEYLYTGEFTLPELIVLMTVFEGAPSTWP